MIEVYSPQRQCKYNTKHVLENKSTGNKKKYLTNEKMTVKTLQYCINKTVSNIVLDVHLLLGTLYLHTFVLSIPYPPLNAT